MSHWRIAMAGRAVALFAAVLAGSVSLSAAETDKPDIAMADPPRVWAEGRTAHYEGATSAAGLAAFEDVVDGMAGLDLLIINSGGGDTVAARGIGRRVHDSGADIVIEGGCFSSCANYVFPAGRKKTISDGAFVGWHGSEAQYDYYALRDKDGVSGNERRRRELREALLAAIEKTVKTTGDKSRVPDEAALEQEVDNQMALAMESFRNEAQYFADLGLTDLFANFGYRPDCADRFAASGKLGWTFPTAEMARLGLTDVVYKGSGRYEDAPKVRKYLMVFDPTDDY